MTDYLEMERLVQLAKELRPAKHRWEPTGLEEYEQGAREFMAGTSRQDAIRLLAVVDQAISRQKAFPAFSMYPPLQSFVERFGGTPSLLVELSINFVAAGGKVLGLASDCLRQAYSRDPKNIDVLWELFNGHHRVNGIPIPSFPAELKMSSDPAEHENKVIKMIIQESADNKLAKTILEWLSSHSDCYHSTRQVPISAYKVAYDTRPTARRSLQNLLQEVEARPTNT